LGGPSGESFGAGVVSKEIIIARVVVIIIVVMDTSTTRRVRVLCRHDFASQSKKMQWAGDAANVGENETNATRGREKGARERNTPTTFLSIALFALYKTLGGAASAPGLSFHCDKSSIEVVNEETSYPPQRIFSNIDRSSAGTTGVFTLQKYTLPGTPTYRRCRFDRRKITAVMAIAME
jgi:hypothetical protein